MKKRSAFTIDEDDRLRELVGKYGESNWHFITQKMPKRTLRQCRERWLNYLSSNISNGPWTREEDELVVCQAALLGHKWRSMVSMFPGRTDINIKNRWNLLRARAARAEKSKKRELSVPDTKAVDFNCSNGFSDLESPEVDPWTFNDLGVFEQPEYAWTF